MIVFNPQWQGSSLDTQEGSKIMYDYFDKNITHRIATERHTMQTSKPIHHYPAVHNHALRYSELLKREKPNNIFTIGGDSTTDFIPITYLNKICPTLKILGVLPANNSDQPRSDRYFLEEVYPALLMGNGDQMMLNYAFSSLEKHQFINHSALRNLEKNTPLYIHIDLAQIDRLDINIAELTKYQIIGGSVSNKTKHHLSNKESLIIAAFKRLLA